ncbi:MAG: OpgC domain-containing protein, partial [Verrucomicrobiota bacterium]|nr:OpgC domain-containing protein [Verrucomicrobiota bacterium]
ILASFAIWASAQFLPIYAGAAIISPLNFGFFNLLAWQFLFIGGVAIGHARTISTASLVPARPALLIAAGAGAAFFFCLQHGYIHSLWPNKTLGIMLNKPSLGALRLGSFAIAAYLVGVAGARFPRLLAWRPLAMLGRHSLVVVAVQCVLVLTLLAHDGFFDTATGRWIVTSATIAAIFAVGAFCDRTKSKTAKKSPAIQPAPGFPAPQTRNQPGPA